MPCPKAILVGTGHCLIVAVEQSNYEKPAVHGHLIGGTMKQILELLYSLHARLDSFGLFHFLGTQHSALCKQV